MEKGEDNDEVSEDEGVGETDVALQARMKREFLDAADQSDEDDLFQ